MARRLNITDDELVFDLRQIGYTTTDHDDDELGSLSFLSARVQLQVEAHRAAVAAGDVTIARPTFLTREEGAARRQARAQEAWLRPLTTAEAATYLKIPRSRLRQWVARGHVRPVGRRGRSNLFSRQDLNQAKVAVEQRTRRPPGLAAGAPAKYLDVLITTDVAARIAKVKPGTIRTWVRRGHLTPKVRHGRQHRFRVIDVIRAARRPAARRIY